jgi:hypothetical protein
MRKKLLICISACTIVFFGCKKMADSFSVNGTNYLESQIREFIAIKITKASPANVINLNETLLKIDFSKMERRRFSETADIIIASINDINVHDFVSTIKKGKHTVRLYSEGSAPTITQNNSVTKVIFYVEKDHIVDGKIVEISSPTYKIEDITEHFADIVHSKRKDFTGHVSINSLSQKLYNDWGIKNGFPISSTVIRNGDIPQSKETNSKRLFQCEAWYLTTTYYWSDGTYIGTERVLLGYTGCGQPEENQVPQDDIPPTGNTPPDTTCAQNQRLANNIQFSDRVNELKDSAGLTYETQFAMYNNPSGGYSYTKFSGNPNTSTISGQISSYPFSMQMLLHNHKDTDMPTFSPSDMQALYLLLTEGHIDNASTFTMAMVKSDGKMQLARITNAAAFIAFGNENLGRYPFPFWATDIQPTLLSYNNEYAKNALFLVKTFANAGIEFYEGNANDLTDGFKKLGTTSTGQLTKTYCSK